MAAIICNKLSELCTNPFSLYVTAAVATNIGPIVAGAQAVPSLGSCHGASFCVGTMVFSAVHVAAAWYIASSISDRGNRRLAGRKTALGRAGYMLCNDPVVAVYILVLIGFFIWLCFGIAWRVEGSIYDCHNCHCHSSTCNQNCPYQIGSWVNTCIGCGFTFFSLCFYALVASFCVAWCCDKTDYSAPEQDEEEAAAYVQYSDDPDPTSDHGLGGGGQDAPTPPLVPVPVPAAGAAVSYGATVTPATNPSYDPNLPTAVAVPVHDAKTST